MRIWKVVFLNEILNISVLTINLINQWKEIYYKVYKLFQTRSINSNNISTIYIKISEFRRPLYFIFLKIPISIREIQNLWNFVAERACVKYVLDKNRLVSLPTG